jgi:hypothetical protein
MRSKSDPRFAGGIGYGVTARAQADMKWRAFPAGQTLDRMASATRSVASPARGKEEVFHERRDPENEHDHDQDPDKSHSPAHPLHGIHHGITFSFVEVAISLSTQS